MSNLFVEVVESNDILAASSEGGLNETVETVYSESGEVLGQKTTYSFSLKNFLNF